MSGDISKLLRDRAVVFGFKQALRELKLGKVEHVIVAKGCPPPIWREIKYYARLAKARVSEFPGTSWELGIACKKAFRTAAVAILKATARRR